MKIFKFTLLWICVTLTMLVTWSIGSLLGNLLTQSGPPVLEDTSSAAYAFLIVCIINSFLLSLLFWITTYYSGYVKSIVLITYVFVVQFFLTQMETYFFSESIGISTRQILSILVSGLISTSVTVLLGIMISNKTNRSAAKYPFSVAISKWAGVFPLLALLTVIVYPLLYLGFGYYIAWQDEDLRIFYSGSPELKSFFTQVSDAFQNGIYFYQVLRGVIWVGFVAPLVLMLQRNSKTVQYLMVALLSSLLPGTLLFIPNPYMPAGIAFTHFIETSSSNFLWGLVITFVINKLYRGDAFVLNDGKAEPRVNSSR